MINLAEVRYDPANAAIWLPTFVEEYKAALDEIERLRSKNAEVGAWLVEERANLILEKIRGGSIITLQDPAERSANAIRQLRAEGKIGGGDGE